MKRKGLAVILFVVPVLLLLAGCAQDSAIRQMEEQNKALVQRIHAEVSNGNLEIFDEVLSPDYVRHCQAMPPELQEIHGTEVFKKFVADFVNAVSNCKDEIGFIMADSNMVAYVTTTTGIQTGPMGDLPPSGKEFMLKNIVIQRIENGKIAETWISWDNVAMLTQLGFFPPSVPDKSEGKVTMKYIRLYSDELGESHFEDVKCRFQTVDFAPPAPPLDISGFGQSDQCVIIRAIPGWEGDWHPAPFRQMHFYLSGEVEVETSDGELRRIKTGDIALVEDISGKGHKSRVVGSTDVIIAAVRLVD